LYFSDIKPSHSPTLTNNHSGNQGNRDIGVGHNINGNHVTALLNSGVTSLNSVGSEHSSLASPVNLAAVSNYTSPSPPKAVPVKIENDGLRGHGLSNSDATGHMNAVTVGAN